MDEFDDFQMAVGQQSSINRISEKSVVNPVHKINQVPNFRNNIFQGLSSSSSTGISTLSSKDKNSVGSRLANYNLGMKCSIPPFVESQNQKDQTLYRKSVVAPPGGDFEQLKVMNYTTNNQPTSLLGEEDKYAALRMLVGIETQESLPNQSTNFTPNSQTDRNAGNAQIKSFNQFTSTPPPTVTAAINKLDLEDDDFASDFGDFQCCTDTKHKEISSATSIKLPSFGNTSTVLNQNTMKSTTMFLKDTSIISEEIFDNKSNVDLKQELEYGDFMCVKPVHQPTRITSPSVNLISSDKTNNSKLQLKNLSQNFNTNLNLIESSSNNSGTFDQFDFLVNSMPSTTDSMKANKVFEDKLKHHQQGDETILNSNYLVDHGNFLPPSFIKTSLIGYDSSGINAIDCNISDIPKCASLDETNNESLELEYVSFGQKEVFNYFGKQKSVDISPETRSIASLDLGCYNGSSECAENNGKLTDQWIFQNSDGGQKMKNATLPSFTSAIESNNKRFDATDAELSANNSTIDKYQCFKEDLQNEMNSFSVNWNRCLECCKEIILNAITFMNGASNSEVLREVVFDEKGFCFIRNLLEVFSVCKRIHESWKRNGGAENIGNLFDEIENLWETLTAFFIGSPAMNSLPVDNEFKHATSEEQQFCGVCIGEVNKLMQQNLVGYEGKVYHLSCANLWINVVDTILPSHSKSK